MGRNNIDTIIHYDMTPEEREEELKAIEEFSKNMEKKIKELQENKDREDMTPEEAIKIIEENQKFFKEAAKFLHQYDDRIKIED